MKAEKMYWFTSDTHFYHRNVIKYCKRPFLTDSDQEYLKANGLLSEDGHWLDEQTPQRDIRISNESVHMMNDVFIETINKYVQPNDVLFHLGDFVMSPKLVYHKNCKSILRRINCTNVHLVRGNHDQYIDTDIFKSVSSNIECFLAGRLFTLSHYCMLTFNKQHRNGIQLYGHSHSSLEPWVDAHLPNRRSMDVGVDNIFKLKGEYRPISLDEVLEMLDHKSGFSADHHR